MGLVTNVTKRIDYPHEPGGFAVIRKLSWKQLRDAGETQSKKNIEGMRAMGAELIKAFRESASAADAAEKARQIENAQAALASNYDREQVLKNGLVSWSYDMKPHDDGAIGALDEATAALLHTEIVAYSREAHDPEAVKNASGSSIAS